MKKKEIWVRVYIILFVGFMLYCSLALRAPDAGTVKNGTANLSDVDLSSGISALNGYWEFYWDKLLTPEDFKEKDLSVDKTLMRVPGGWNEYDSKRHSVYPHMGAATYRLVLEYPDTIEAPAIKLKKIPRAYNLYVNGLVAASAGIVAKEPSDFRGGFSNVIVDLPAGGRAELIVQVACFENVSGGIRDSVIFGEKGQLEKRKILLYSIQLLFLGSILVFGVFHLVSFLMQKENRSALYLSILCFLCACRSFLWGEMPFLTFFPEPDTRFFTFANYLTSYNIVPATAIFVSSFFPAAFDRKKLLALIIPVFILEALIYSHLIPIIFIENFIYLFSLIQMIYIMSVLVRLSLKGRANAALMLTAIGLMFLTMYGDLLYYRGQSRFIMSYLVLFGNFFVIAAMVFIRLMQMVQTNIDLKHSNEKLLEADQLKDRIMDTEMAFLQAQIKPHFLYNALSAIANVCEKDARHAGKLIIDLAVYLRNSFEFNNMDKMVSIQDEIEFVDTYYNIEMARFGDKIRLEKDIAAAPDIRIPRLILQPLVENAVRHGISKTIEGGTVHLSIKEAGGGLSVEIKDDGAGIDAEKLAMILSGERTVKGKGVGLINIQNRLLRLYGRGLSIESRVGEGTCISFVIPVEGTLT